MLENHTKIIEIILKLLKITSKLAKILEKHVNIIEKILDKRTLAILDCIYGIVTHAGDEPLPSLIWFRVWKVI